MTTELSCMVAEERVLCEVSSRIPEKGGTSEQISR